MDTRRVDGVRRPQDAASVPSSRAWFVNGAHCHSTFDFLRSIFSLRFFSTASCWAFDLDEARKERTMIASVKMQQPMRKGADSLEGGHTFL